MILRNIIGGAMKKRKIDKKWIRLRNTILKYHGFSCMKCGITPPSRRWVHIDHIKPVSLYPTLKYSLSNLQVLCKECNISKSNKYIADYRPEEMKKKFGSTPDIPEKKKRQRKKYRNLAVPLTTPLQNVTNARKIRVVKKIVEPT